MEGLMLGKMSTQPVNFGRSSKSPVRAARAQAPIESFVLLSECARPHRSSLDFASLWQGYASIGGLARFGRVLADTRCNADPTVPERFLESIARRKVLIFPEQHELWLPVFQFATPDLHPWTAVPSAVTHMRSVLDEVDLAAWFCTPNARLGGRRPAALVRHRPQAVAVAAAKDARSLLRELR